MLVQCLCNVTNQTYLARAQRAEYVNGVYFIWSQCPYCDNERRTASDADYNAAAPQWHCQQIEVAQERERAA